MKVLICGASLQGLELAYLGLKAGWETTLVDRLKEPIAINIANNFKCLDLDKINLLNLFKNHDLIIPALENKQTLHHIELLHKKDSKCPIAFDFDAYKISSSKNNSKNLFDQLSILNPKKYCSFNSSWPIIAKPDNASGSNGIKIMHNISELSTFFTNIKNKNNYLLEEYIKGSFYSIEIISNRFWSKTFPVTKLYMDKNKDCSKVFAPSNLTIKEKKTIQAMAQKLASALNLNGIMDLELIKCGSNFYLMEIDARFPSQTPIAVYWSSNYNLAEELAKSYYKIKCENTITNNFVSLEYIFNNSKKLTFRGESEFLALKKPVKLVYNFFGADEALVIENEKRVFQAAAVIIKDTSLLELKKKRKKVYQQLKESIEAQKY